MRLPVLSASMLSAVVALSADAGTSDPTGYSAPVTSSYSQKTLLKNWAMSVCLAEVAKDAGTKADANATAAAYLEFGHQSIEAYDQLRTLIDKYASKKYGGSVDSEYNTMKCIDLLNSKELDALTGKLSKTR